MNATVPISAPEPNTTIGQFAGLPATLLCRHRGWERCRRGRPCGLDHHPSGADCARQLWLPVAAVWAFYKSTFKDACVMDWTQEEATMELTARLQVISLGHQKQGRR